MVGLHSKIYCLICHGTDHQYMHTFADSLNLKMAANMASKTLKYAYHSS